LFERQFALLRHRAAPEIIKCLEELNLCQQKIPTFDSLNTRLKQATGFSLVPVSGFIPAHLFFKLLSQRQFPCTHFIRKAHQLDYLPEPDIFHDLFGHVPLLMDPIFADFMQAFGVKGLEAIELDLLHWAGTLYWFTVEFGLISTSQGLRIYGAGITSSKQESLYALGSHQPIRIPFNAFQIIQTKYAIDSLQNTYFVVDDFSQLFDTLHHLDWHQINADIIINQGG
jgi:phenylalanine-4-hydroxylase